MASQSGGHRRKACHHPGPCDRQNNLPPPRDSVLFRSLQNSDRWQPLPAQPARCKIPRLHRLRPKKLLLEFAYASTSGLGFMRYWLRIASADQYASAQTVPVGLYPAFCGNELAPMTKRLETSQLWRSRFTTLVFGSVPITAPPFKCVV